MRRLGRRVLAGLGVLLSGMVGAFGALGFGLALIFETDSYFGPDAGARSWYLAVSGVGLVGSLFVPAGAIVAIFRGRFWWWLVVVLGACTCVGYVALVENFATEP